MPNDPVIHFAMRRNLKKINCPAGFLMAEKDAHHITTMLLYVGEQLIKLKEVR